MIKIVNEYVIRTEDQKDIIIDRIYNDPKLRRYRDFLDIFFYRAEQTIKNYPLSSTHQLDLIKWVKILKDQCRFSIIDSYWMNSNWMWDEKISREDFAEMLGINSTKDDYWREIEGKLKNILGTINLILKQDETLKIDLFYSQSDTNPNIEDNDWNIISSLVPRISEYTDSYNIKFTEEEIETIKKHMKKTSQTLYRIEEYNNYSPFLKYQKDGEKIFDWSKELKSFTEDPNCDTMIGMKRERQNGTGKIIIYETVGNVYSFNIDQLSNYAKDINTIEYEHFVSGKFEIVEFFIEEDENIDEYGRDHCDIVKVKIKQISK